MQGEIISTATRRKFRGVLIFCVAACCVATLATAAIVIRTYRSFSIDSKEYIMNRRDASVILLDRHDTVFFAFEHARRKHLAPLHHIPPHIRQAVIAAEDKNFYNHLGFSPRGIVRSIYLNFSAGRIVSGGSTITQQLIKNAYFSPDRSFYRKFRELILALKLEQHYSKDDILEMYLNTAYFGEGVFGIEQAAQTYFAKSVRELSLTEASMLAGLLPAPSALSPRNDLANKLAARQDYVLNQMIAAGFIQAHEKEAAQATAVTLRQVPELINQHAPHFALMVWNELIQKFGEEEVLRSGFKVRTTLDLEWQQVAEKTIHGYVQDLARSHVSNGAAAVIEPSSGEIKALVGTVDWHNKDFGKINMALTPRQPGSAFKPIVYATAFERAHLTPSTILQDKPQTFGRDYRPRNYDGRFRGPVSTRYALANSLNIPAVEVISQITPAAVITTAEQLGVKTLSKEARHNLSLALGSEPVSLLELTGAYATFGNSGWYNQPTTILSIKDKRNKVVYEHRPAPHRALTASTAFLISSILSDTEARRPTFGNLLTLSPPRPAAVKTGTTQSFRDGWTVGYTPQLAIGVWIGNSNNEPMINLPGARAATPVWQTLMNQFTEDLPATAFDPPPTVIARRVCRGSGLLMPENSRAGYTEYFIRGTEPTSYCHATSTPAPDTSPVPSPDTAITKKNDRPKIPQADARAMKPDNNNGSVRHLTLKKEGDKPPS